MKNNQKSKLQKQLFRKYLVGFIVFQLLFILVSNTSVAVLSNTFADNLFMVDDIYKKVKKEGVEAIDIDPTAHPGAYIELVDQDYVVTYADNSPREVGYQYSETEIKELLNKESSIPGERGFFLEENLDFLVINERDDDRLTFLLLVSILTLIIILLLTYILFFQLMARIISSTIENPINQLIQGINDFKNKMYSSRISFAADNELDDLKNAFNEMAGTIEEQIALREKAEAINKQLILDVTHDLKTPLATIEGYSDLLVSQAELSRSDQAKYLGIIARNSQRTNNLMQDLFDLTRIEHEGYQLTRTRVDFAEFLRRIVSEYLVFFEDAAKDYSFDIPDGPVYMELDADMMDRALCNIINNFLDHSGENTKLTVVLEEVADEVVLEISDDGKGLEKELVETIFLPFSMGDESRNTSTSGTGLGLAITKKIIEKHQGTIDLVSALNQGTEFRIVLPKEHGIVEKEKVGSMKIKNITHHYEDFTLKIDDLSFSENTVIGLIGENGAGKTTLMDLLSQMIVANERFDVENYVVDDILYVPSDITPYDFLTVTEFCEMVIRYADSTRTPAAVIEELGLTDKADTLIAKLSQGMKKKLTLINLFLKDYSLVILDEPFNSIDLQYSYEIKKIITELKEKSTVLISSHIVDSLLDICDEFVLLQGGSVAKTFTNTGDKEELEAELFG